MDLEDQGTEGPKPRKKKRWLVVLRNVLLVLLLLSGVVSGLRISGGLNEIFEAANPVMARVPLVGETLVSMMDSVERPMNVQERRALELQEMEAALVSREESLREEMQKLKADRAGLERQREELKREAEKRSRAGKVPRRAEESEALTGLVRGFEDMSSRKAAGIIARLSRERATQIMGALSQEKMAEILAKMEPAQAAKMVEVLSQESSGSGSSP